MYNLRKHVSIDPALIQSIQVGNAQREKGKFCVYVAMSGNSRSIASPTFDTEEDAFQLKEHLEKLKEEALNERH